MNISNLLGVIGAIDLAQFGLSQLVKYAGKGQSYETVINGVPITVEYDPRGMSFGGIVAETNSVWKNILSKEVTRASIRADGIFFSVLTEEERAIMVAHELGHLVAPGGDDVDMTEYHIMRELGICPKCEKAADAYAASIYGKDAVIRTLSKLALIGTITSKIEIAQRIAAVKALPDSATATATA